MASAEDAVVIERKGSVALISFNRPERLNAWSKDIGSGLLQRLREAEADESVRGRRAHRQRSRLLGWR